MRLLLDTAVLIFAMATPDRLSKRAATVLRDPGNIREVSAISLTEIAVKTTLGKLNILAQDARQAIQDLDLRILPFTSEHAFALFSLPPHHRDPFDRQIIAQAICERVPLVTPDRRLSLYRGVDLIW